MSAEHFELHLNRYSEYPQVQLLDVTLRDGSFAVNFQWDSKSVETIVDSLARAHIPYIELGYYGGVPELHGVARPGLTADFPLSFAFELSRRHPSVKFVLMVHPGSAGSDLDFQAIAQSGISLVRFVYHPSWHREFCELIASCKKAGLRASANLALASRYSLKELLDIVTKVSDLEPQMIYLADTCSALYPDQVKNLFEAISNQTLIELGFHSHDFLSLAFANSISASNAGASFIDSSLLGIGRGSGNLRTELWCATATAQDVSRFDLPSLTSGLDHIKATKDLVMHDDLLSIVAGACNLTPPEEDVLRNTCRQSEISEDLAATLFVLRHREMQSVTSEAIRNILTVGCTR